MALEEKRVADEEKQVEEKLFGMAAIRLGFVTAKEVLDCLSQQMLAEAVLGNRYRIGEIMVLRGLLDAEQYRKVLGDAVPAAVPQAPALPMPVPLLGEVLIELGYATPEIVLECLNIQRHEEAQNGSHRYLGEILIEIGAIDVKQLDEALGLARARRSRPEPGAEGAVDPGKRLGPEHGHLLKKPDES